MKPELKTEPPASKSAAAVFLEAGLGPDLVAPAARLRLPWLHLQLLPFSVEFSGVMMSHGCSKALGRPALALQRQCL